jgi:hypothetical protein
VPSIRSANAGRLDAATFDALRPGFGGRPEPRSPARNRRETLPPAAEEAQARGYDRACTGAIIFGAPTDPAGVSDAFPTFQDASFNSLWGKTKVMPAISSWRTILESWSAVARPSASH